MRALRLLALLPFASAAHLHAARSSTTACNNSPALCSKSYGEITHLGAHDSPFVYGSATGDSLAANQYYNTTTQLDAGVRLVTAQVHNSNGEWRLCHTLCELMDAGLLSTWLGNIKTWLDGNPNDVVTVLLVNSDSATASELNAQFQTANITDYAYVPQSSSSAPSSWPTLQEMINDGKRLVTFVASIDASEEAPYLMDEWTYLWETPYDVSTPTNYSCVPNRPPAVAGDTSTALSSDRLPLMNHFLYSEGLSFIGVEYPNASYVSTTNAPSGGVGNLGSAATKCKSAWGGRQPTFILVDFFNQGPAIDTVDSLNNVTNAVGRSSVSASSSTQSNAGSTKSNVFTALVHLANSARSGATPSIGNWVWVGGNWGNLHGGGIPF
ncbi:hypothetical protein N7510_003753 [Penicillium lagena]|uniref:uncharacterized protein n=1 Tax=Penicillium lagena TaxID=94218 RepID=UPI00253FE944|nr:uncharacterized protein N7510_003753 [Penicillium lagena]KAJ5619769.1 hypothetical protein N7510_003753 [Penicillium lagena]